MFTFQHDPSVEEALRKQMAVVVEETSRVYGNDCTIILAGGFGRGEGSIRLLDNGTPLPLHDFDLFVVTDKTVSDEQQSVLEGTILAKLSVLTTVDLSKEKFVLGMQVIPLQSLKRLPPDLSTYELKAASTVLNGPDIRPEIVLQESDVALGSGAITLFHRVTALLKNVEPEFLGEGLYPTERSLEAIYECCKVYTEICTAMSLLGQFYEPSYLKRAENFGSNYHRFPDLQRRLPNLDRKVMEYTEMKLRSDFSPILTRPAEVWVETRRDLNTVLRYFLSKFLRIPAEEPWPLFCHRAERRLRWFFFRDYISYVLSSYGLEISPIVSMTNLLFQAYDSAVFQRKVRRLGKRPANQLVSFTSPILRVYLASALVLFALQDDGSVDQLLLTESRKYMGKFLQGVQGSGSPSKLWQRARDDCVEGQRLYFGVNKTKRAF